MIYEHFTSTEIATIIHELGYKAHIFRGEKFLWIESASSGTRWTIRLIGTEPFFESMHLSISVWVKTDSLLWCNDWNSNHGWSSAHIEMAEEDDRPVADSDGDFHIIVSTTLNFVGGITESHLTQCLNQWLAIVEEIVQIDDVILPAIPTFPKR